MANRNTRPIGFQGQDLANSVRINTQLPAVQRSTGSDFEEVAKASDVLSHRISRFADEAAQVEAEQQAKADAASGAFKPRGDASIYSQQYDKTGGDLYFSKLNAQFESEAQTLYQQHKDDPSGWQSNYKQLVDKYKRDDVYPQFHAAFDAKATRLDTSYRAAALDAFEKKQKDTRLASFVSDMRTSETTRAQMLAIDPNAPDVEKNITDMTEAQILRIKSLRDNGDISAVKAEEMTALARSEARVSVLSARAEKLQTPEDVSKFQAQLREQFAAGKVNGLDGDSWQKLDAGLTKLAKTKKIEADRAESELQGKFADFLDRQSKGLQPSVTELTALAAQAEKLGPRGAVMLDEARQKLQIRQLLDSVSIERGAQMIDELKRGATNGGRASAEEAQAVAFFRSRGWSQVAAVGIVGNLANEGLKDTASRNPGDGRDGSDSIGIAQWNADRARALKAFAAERGKDWTDRETQLAFVDHELRTTERKAGEALARAGSVEDATRAGIGYFRPAGWSEANPEAGMHYDGRLGHSRRLASAGIGGSPAAVIEDAQGYLEKRRKAMDTDMLGEAAKSGTIAQVSELDWQGADLKGQIGARVSQAEAVAKANDRAPQYLRPGEKDRLREVIQQGGDKALALVDQIVEGSGKRAPAILKEIEPAAPRLAMLGVMLSRGNEYQRDAARDAFEALRLEQQPGAKIVGNPKSSADIEREEFGSSFGPAIADKQRAVDAARLIYRGKMARHGYDPDSREAETLYRESLQAAMGRSGKDASSATGGVADYTPPGFNWGAAKVAVPDRVIAKRLPDVFASITDQDLKDYPGGAPKDASGQDYGARIFRKSYPVQVPGGYAFQVNPPGSEDPQFVRGANGRPFVLDWEWFAPRARSRVPQAFR